MYLLLSCLLLLVWKLWIISFFVTFSLHMNTKYSFLFLPGNSSDALSAYDEAETLAKNNEELLTRINHGRKIAAKNMADIHQG